MWDLGRVYHGEVLCNRGYPSSVVQIVLIIPTLLPDNDGLVFQQSLRWECRVAHLRSLWKPGKTCIQERMNESRADLHPYCYFCWEAEGLYQLYLSSPSIHWTYSVARTESGASVTGPYMRERPPDRCRHMLKLTWRMWRRQLDSRQTSW